MSEHDHALHRFFFVNQLLRVRCNRCGSPIASYRVMDVECEECRTDDGWVPAEGKRCSCDPPPRLPEGDELAKWIARARTKQSGEQNRSSPRAPITIRV